MERLFAAVQAATVQEERRLETELFGKDDTRADLPAAPSKFTCRFCESAIGEAPTAWCSHCKGMGALHPDGWICGACATAHEQKGEHSLLLLSPRLTDFIPPEGAILSTAKPVHAVEHVVGRISQSPAFGRHGHLIVPHGSNVGVYDLHGPGGVAQHSQITPASVGLSRSTFVAACEPHSRTLLLADAVHGGSDVVAVHVDTHSVIWRSDAFDASSGVAVLGEQGIAVASSQNDDAVHVHRMLDGARISTLEGVDAPSYVAADARAGVVYVAVHKERVGGSVRAFRWAGEAGLVPFPEATAQLAAAVPPSRGRRPLVVVPQLFGHDPAGGTGSISYLVVGTMRTPYVHVVSLPDHRLVAVLQLGGDPAVVGFAADPGGATGGGHGRRGHAAAREPSLVVCDAASRAALVFRWPLPEIPSPPPPPAGGAGIDVGAVAAHSGSTAGTHAHAAAGAHSHSAHHGHNSHKQHHTTHTSSH